MSAKPQNTGKAGIFVEINAGGVERVVIVSDQDDADQQAAAHELLARIAPQLLLLNAALKDPSEATTPSR